MNRIQWETLLKTVKGENTSLEAAMIVDSPWIPGYCEINTIDFFARPDVWLSAHEKIKADFPDLLFLPDYWVEYGMALEPSGFGGKVDFYPNSPPTVHHIVEDVDDVDTINSLEVPDPNKSGLMPMALRLQRYYSSLLDKKGESIKIVSTRGPLTTASHLMGVTDLLLLTKLYPDVAHTLLKKTTQLCIGWLAAQIEAVGSAEGILLLDDVCGFFGNDDYLEFAHPYLKEIFDAFAGKVKLMHNDSESDVIYPHLADLKIDIYQPTYTRPISEIRQKIDNNITILGTLSAMSLVEDTPEQVRQATSQMIEEYKRANGDSTKRLLVSTGGGAPMGAKGECIKALIDGVRQFNDIPAGK
ncbi:MAG TPA: uroporphyrinogen decarboxylase family protein [Bacillota bacterium]|nr:uroporphyrinogen decarboxylase family protein [Bacillota bacterium]